MLTIATIPVLLIQNVPKWKSFLRGHVVLEKEFLLNFSFSSFRVLYWKTQTFVGKGEKMGGIE